MVDPTKVVGRLSDPLFSPSFSYEKNGVVDNVVFPTSAFIIGKRLHIYYGAGDKVIAMKSINFENLMRDLLGSPIPQPR